MTTKLTVEQRKQRALLNAKNFAVKRSVQRKYELAWALNGAALPEGVVTPPDWVRKCIGRCVETSFKNLNKLRPKDGKATMPQLQEVLGAARAYMSILENPLSEFPPDMPAEIKAMVTDLARLTKRSMGPEIQTLKHAMVELKPHLRAATLSELRANSVAHDKGIRSVKLSGGSEKEELYQLLWFFWPMLKDIKPARKLLEAVESVTDIKFGFKTFAAVCTDIGIFEGKRGRPHARKFLEIQREL